MRHVVCMISENFILGYQLFPSKDMATAFGLGYEQAAQDFGAGLVYALVITSPSSKKVFDELMITQSTDTNWQDIVNNNPWKEEV